METPKEIPPQIDKVIRKIYETSKLGLNPDPEIMLCPALVFVKFDGPEEYHIMATPVHELMSNKVSKAVLETIIERMIQDDEVDVIVLVTEAWMVKRSKLTKEEARSMRPSQEADREEYVYYMATTKTKQIQAYAPIIREPLGLGELIYNVMTEEDEGIFVREKKDTPSVQ